MGRIKTDMIKRNTRKIVAMYPEKFSKTFDKNKADLKDVAEFGSKKVRNVIAGYVSRLKKKGEQAPRPRKREDPREMRPMRPRQDRY
jgi:small subunit ribosomal protein S17e